MTNSTSFSLWVEEKYSELPRILSKPRLQSQEPKLVIEKLPSLELTLELEEVYQSLERLAPDPQLLMPTSMTEEQRIQEKILETRKLIYDLRHRYSLECRNRNEQLSPEASRRLKRCRTCYVNVDPRRRSLLKVGKYIIESKPDILQLTEYEGLDKANWWHICFHCDMVLEDEMLQEEYWTWLHMLTYKTQDLGEVPFARREKMPKFEEWKSAYMEDMRSQGKKSSSLNRLASTVDSLRTGYEKLHGKEGSDRKSSMSFHGRQE